MLRAGLAADPKVQSTDSGGLTGLLARTLDWVGGADEAEQVGSWWERLGESRVREAGNGGGNEQAGRLLGGDHRGQVGWHWNTEEKHKTKIKTSRPGHMYHTG